MMHWLPRCVGSSLRLNTALDFMALLMGATGLGLNVLYWSIALLSDKDKITIVVNRYHEGVGEFIMFVGLTAFVAWRAGCRIMWRRNYRD